MSVNELSKYLRSQLIPIYGERESDAIVRLIFHYLKGWNLTEILIHNEDQVSPFIKAEAENILSRLKNNEPIQYITGEARFHGMDFKVDKNVLIPRQETDELTDIVIDENKEAEDLRVLDLGTGSGCIAISLARNLKFPDVTAIDNSEDALKVAKENAANLKAKVNFQHEDLFNWMPNSKVDIIISNPPYIERDEIRDMEKNVVDYEPHSALFVPESDTMKFNRRIAQIALNKLSKNGTVYIEINPRHSEEIKKIFSDFGFKPEIRLDSFGKKRFLIARRNL